MVEKIKNNLGPFTSELLKIGVIIAGTLIGFYYQTNSHFEVIDKIIEKHENRIESQGEKITEIKQNVAVHENRLNYMDAKDNSRGKYKQFKND
jgi:regulator of sigma D